ncbi:MAG: hypothetical protein KF812_04030 [Fimbriimonadaceae bacterium]|nr:hypothetical protein [Fimbriimonadaceae bacterium]
MAWTQIVAAFDKAQIRYVVGGSTAMMLHGVETDPNDLDIIPDTSPENLTRLASLLTRLDAVNQGGPGHWLRDEEGEWKWMVVPENEEWRERCQNWQFDPHDPLTFDASFSTTLGSLDIVPEISGQYEDLIRRSVTKSVGAVEVHVVHVTDLLNTVTVPRRKKDHLRVAQLRQIQSDLLA